jgi:predicted aspartyl protease
LRITANLDQNLHGHIYAYIICSQFSNPRPIHLVVDIGSTITTILGDDVTRLAINCSSLSLAPNPTITASGSIIPYIMPNVILMMEVEYGLFNRNRSFANFHLNMVQCMPPAPPTSAMPRRMHDTYSLLGMDILGLFKKWHWHHRQRELILET